MSITGLSGASFAAGQALQNVGSKSDPVGAAGQQVAPAQDFAAAPSNTLRGLLPDPRIAAQLKPNGAMNNAASGQGASSGANCLMGMPDPNWMDNKGHPTFPRFPWLL